MLMSMLKPHTLIFVCWFCRLSKFWKRIRLVLFCFYTAEKNHFDFEFREADLRQISFRFYLLCGLAYIKRKSFKIDNHMGAKIIYDNEFFGTIVVTLKLIHYGFNNCWKHASVWGILIYDKFKLFCMQIDLSKILVKFQ